MAVAGFGNAGWLPNEDIFPCSRIRERKLVGGNSYYRAIALVEILNVVNQFALRQIVELGKNSRSIQACSREPTEWMKEKIIEEERNYVSG